MAHKRQRDNAPSAGRSHSRRVFIDIIGRPWTSVSYAGVARRNYRRAWAKRANSSGQPVSQDVARPFPSIGQETIKSR